MPVKPLPANPDLNHLRYQAKDLLKARALRDPESAQRIREFHPRFNKATDDGIFAAPFGLVDAQLTIAREHGFPSWSRMKARIERPTTTDRLDLPYQERIADAAFRLAVDLLDVGDVAGLRAHLRHHPDLVRRHVVFDGGNYFRNPTLLEFIAENPTRRGTLPRNVVDVATVILEAGVIQSAPDETLNLVASSNVARECGVQVSLIALLCDYGADPNSATRTAAIHAEFEAVKALIRRGAHVDLPLATALGQIEDFHRLLQFSSSEDRHWALALASQFGQVEIVRILLDAGEDPNRYNPVGGHSHSTPLHQAAAAGNGDLVRLLVERGAKLDWKDTMWQAIPAEWARHEGKTEIEAYLHAHSTVSHKLQ
jgi:Ankyrin repeats (3 copies)